MKAMRMHGYGDVSVLSYDDIPTPAPGDGEVLVDVAATSFNPSELGLRRGLLRTVFEVDLPHTLGNDVAGTVDGRPVIGLLDGGAAARHAVAPAGVLVPAPATIPLTHAAALPVAGLTAWQAVHEHAAVTAGQRVLITGIGAVGRLAVQLARNAGAHVIAVAGPRSRDAARELGAAQVLDYTDPHRVLDEPVDVLLHCAAAPVDAAPVRDGGILVSATVPVTTGIHFVTRNDPAHLAALVALVDRGELRLDIAAARPLRDLPRVHLDAETGRLPGKTVLLPE
jgi:NADPH:quinone reductase-like Zn-dependent oxidoreductase